MAISISLSTHKLVAQRVSFDAPPLFRSGDTSYQLPDCTPFLPNTTKSTPPGALQVSHSIIILSTLVDFLRIKLAEPIDAEIEDILIRCHHYSGPY